MLSRALGTVAIGLLLNSPSHTGIKPRAHAQRERMTHTSRESSVRSHHNLTCTSYPCPAGVMWYYFTDPNCPDSPDTFEAYVEYWYADESFAYDVDAGHSTYDCGDGYHAGNVQSSPAYQDCLNNSPWNCQTLGMSWDPHP